MQNPRSNDDRPEPSDSSETELDDIEAMLSEDLMLGKDALVGPGGVLDDHKTDSRFRRLQLRTRHIASNLQDAIESITDLQELLDDDRRCDGQFVAELYNWDRVMTQLEQYVKNRPDKPAPYEAKEASDSLLEQLEHELEVREEKIRSLELQLAELRGADNMFEELEADPYVNRVIVATNGKENLKFPLADNIIMIGRDRSNNIQLKATYVSRFHARILNDSDSAYIEDLDSLNGVMVNSERIHRQKLRSGDLIGIGRIQLKYIDLMEGSSGEGQA